MTITVKKLENAINTIAEYLNEPYEFVDQDTGETEERNSMWYPQKRILNGIAYSATKTLESAETYLSKAQAIARAAARSHTGDEISDEKLNKALDSVERASLQVETLHQLQVVAMNHYQRHTGEEFKTRTVPINAKVDPDNLSEAQKRARALLGTGEGNRGGGVEVAAAEAA